MKQTAIRITADLEDFAQTVCRIEGISMNSLITRALDFHFQQLKNDPDFKARARSLIQSELRVLESLGEN